MGYDVAHSLKMQLEARTRALDFYGKVMSFFFLASIMAIYNSIKNFGNSKDAKYRIELDLLSYLLPFVSFVIDASVKRAYSLSAKSVFICLKIFLIFYYLGIYVITLQKTPETKFFWIANVNLFVFPILITIYWFLLISGRLS